MSWMPEEEIKSGK